MFLGRLFLTRQSRLLADHNHVGNKHCEIVSRVASFHLIDCLSNDTQIIRESHSSDQGICKEYKKQFDDLFFQK